MQEKKKFRANCLQKLKHQAQTNKLHSDYCVLKQLKKILHGTKGKTILLYIPLGYEVNVMKLMRRLRRNNRVLVPFMEGVSFKVLKFRLPLHKKKFSLLEPNNSFAIFSSIDIAIIPVVGVDRELRRIGHGKGMYDRFFESLHYRPLTIFVQLATCKSAGNLGEAHDIQADYYISPNHFIKRRGINDFRIFNRRRCGAS